MPSLSVPEMTLSRMMLSSIVTPAAPSRSMASSRLSSFSQHGTLPGLEDDERSMKAFSHLGLVGTHRTGAHSVHIPSLLFLHNYWVYCLWWPRANPDSIQYTER